MMMACIVTPWIGSGTTKPSTDPYRPKLFDDHPLTDQGSSWSDITGTALANLIPSPNALVVQVVCADAWLQTVSNDPNYAPGILWSQSL